MNITFSDFFRSFKTFADDEFLRKNYIYSDSELMNFLFEPLIKKRTLIIKMQIYYTWTNQELVSF